LNCILDWFFEAEHSALPEPESKKKKRRRNRHGLTVIKRSPWERFPYFSSP
jgi:hypothetical protein